MNVIFTASREKGESLLNQIKEDKLQKGIDVIEYWRTKNHSFMHFKDGEGWRTLNPVYGVRGYKCVKSYIDKDLEDKYIRMIHYYCCNPEISEEPILF